MNEPDKDIYNFGDDIYAVKFPYAVVSEMTLNMALPIWFSNMMAKDNMQAKFAGETQETAGQNRADSEQIRKLFPIEISMLKGFLKKKQLKDYVMFKLEGY